MDTIHRLQLYTAETHPRDLPLHVLSKMDWAAQPYHGTAAIIGESHYLTIQKGDQTFTEILACLEIPCESAHAWKMEELSGQIGAKIHREERPFHGDLYQVSVSIIALDNNQIDQFCRPAEAEYSLAYCFPNRYPNLQTPSAPPLTAIRINLLHRQPGIKWETLHVYPEAGCMVLSHSALCP